MKRSRVTISRCRDRLVDVGSPGRVHINPAFFRRVAMEKDTMKHMRAFLAAAAFACVFAGSLGSAKTPEPAPAGNTPTPAAPASSEPSDVSQVEKWTKKKWNNAVKEWAQDETKWAGCKEQSKAKKLSGRKSWSFLYGCMTK
jgi:hypothetical protein